MTKSHMPEIRVARNMKRVEQFFEMFHVIKATSLFTQANYPPRSQILQDTIIWK